MIPRILKKYPLERIFKGVFNSGCISNCFQPNNFTYRYLSSYKSFLESLFAGKGIA